MAMFRCDGGKTLSNPRFIFSAGAEDFHGQSANYKYTPVIYAYNNDVVSYNQDTNEFTFKKNVTVTTRTVITGTGEPRAYYQINSGTEVQCSSISEFLIKTLTLSAGDTLKIFYRNNAGAPYYTRGVVTCMLKS